MFISARFVIPHPPQPSACTSFTSFTNLPPSYIDHVHWRLDKEELEQSTGIMLLQTEWYANPGLRWNETQHEPGRWQWCHKFEITSRTENSNLLCTREHEVSSESKAIWIVCGKREMQVYRGFLHSMYVFPSMAMHQYFIDPGCHRMNQLVILDV